MVGRAVLLIIKKAHLLSVAHLYVLGINLLKSKHLTAQSVVASTRVVHSSKDAKVPMCKVWSTCMLKGSFGCWHWPQLILTVEHLMMSTMEHQWTLSLYTMELPRVVTYLLKSRIKASLRLYCTSWLLSHFGPKVCLWNRHCQIDQKCGAGWIGIWNLGVQPDDLTRSRSFVVYFLGLAGNIVAPLSDCGRLQYYPYTVNFAMSYPPAR